MRKPVIGITTGRVNRGTPEQYVQDVTVGCDIDYITAVQRAGGAPVLLPRGLSAEEIAAVVEGLDGVLLSGGGDILALAYGEEPHPASRLQDPVRDESEFALTRAVLARDLPLLGICRGLQVLNVALGGTLLQDIPSQHPGACKHYSEGLTPVPLHTAIIEEDTLLARVLGMTELAVNSWHHQAALQLGEGLRVNCRARDGIIEGLESSLGHPVLAIQCHPEEVAPRYPHFQKLFDWLVQEALSRRGVGV